MSYADEARDALANGASDAAIHALIINAEQADSEIATLTTEVERLTKIIDLAIYEVLRADQKAEDEAKRIEDPDPAAEETSSTDQVPAEEITE